MVSLELTLDKQRNNENSRNEEVSSNVKGSKLVELLIFLLSGWKPGQNEKDVMKINLHCILDYTWNHLGNGEAHL